MVCPTPHPDSHDAPVRPVIDADPTCTRRPRSKRSTPVSFTLDPKIHSSAYLGVFMKITVSTVIPAPISEVWRLYNSGEDIEIWNTPSPDWHTTASTVDLRVGGQFSSRMEAKDGSFGFDFAGEFTKINASRLIEYKFGERVGQVKFSKGPAGVTVTVTFDAEETHSEEQQRGGWQAILDSFGRHVLVSQRNSKNRG